MSDTPNILIIEARFYEDITDELARGVIQVLDDAGVGYERIAVPGVFEIPAAMRFAIRAMEIQSAAHRYSGFITLGCVIRGETDHYDHICRESSRALMELTTEFCVAHGWGVLTCEDYEQARVRASVEQKNKGADAAVACLRMMAIKKQMRLSPQ
ncbi:MAG: 6,7-dimethyl-8-ribityllumazine synthase [Hyphomicrobiales bacterium]|nr:6,7-dimethyl-8-ribityllumazine synthase [Hyphomicrobiales bacterium]MCP5373502.1 6,7-dimethyl-8-ribityllumazine synthase [Hyphomicrobiales bacterium]